MTVYNQNNKKEYFNNLKNISSLDGRYKVETNYLKQYFSEHVLHCYRTYVELIHLYYLSHEDINIDPIDNINELLETVLKSRNINHAINTFSTYPIVEYDHYGRNNIGPTEHDIKSVELYIQEKLFNTKFEKYIPYIHFGLTSEDINNISYSLMLKNCINEIVLPKTKSLIDTLASLTSLYKNIPFLSRTHGQPASPTTLGKEFSIYLDKLLSTHAKLTQNRLSAKLNGAVGNYNAFIAAYPNINWINYSIKLIQHFDLDPCLISDQRGPKDQIISLFSILKLLNSIIKDLNIDLWLYVSRDLIIQKPSSSHVGSSTMPHKINPWLIECSESNTEISTSLYETFERELNVSRLQRDLSCHDLERNYGLAIGHTLIAVSYTTQFLNNISINNNLIENELNNNNKVLSEAYQTILRSHNIDNAFMVFKDLFRNNYNPSIEQIHEIINDLNINIEIKNQLKQINIFNYIGLSIQLTNIVLDKYNRQMLND